MHNRSTFGPRRYLPMVRSGEAALKATSYGQPASLGNATSTAYTLTTGGIYVPSQLPYPIFPIGDALVLSLYAFGRHATDPENKNFVFRVWLTKTMLSAEGQPADLVMAQLYGAGTAELANNTAAFAGPNATNRILDSSERLADTMTFTLAATSTSPLGAATLLQTGLNEGTVQVYNPGGTTANSDVASLIIPCAGRADGIMIDIDRDAGGAAVDSANFLIEARAA